MNEIEMKIQEVLDLVPDDYKESVTSTSCAGTKLEVIIEYINKISINTHDENMWRYNKNA